MRLSCKGPLTYRLPSGSLRGAGLKGGLAVGGVCGQVLE